MRIKNSFQDLFFAIRYAIIGLAMKLCVSGVALLIIGCKDIQGDKPVVSVNDSMSGVSDLSAEIGDTKGSTGEIGNPKPGRPSREIKETTRLPVDVTRTVVLTTGQLLDEMLKSWKIIEPVSYESPFEYARRRLNSLRERVGNSGPLTELTVYEIAGNFADWIDGLNLCNSVMLEIVNLEISEWRHRSGQCWRDLEGRIDGMNDLFKSKVVEFPFHAMKTFPVRAPENSTDSIIAVMRESGRMIADLVEQAGHILDVSRMLGLYFNAISEKLESLLSDRRKALLPFHIARGEAIELITLARSCVAHFVSARESIKTRFTTTSAEEIVSTFRGSVDCGSESTREMHTRLMRQAIHKMAELLVSQRSLFGTVDLWSR